MNKESSIERRLIKEVEKLGGKCYKWVSPGVAGVPDRIVLLPGAIIVFVELKAEGEKPRPLQELRAKQLRNLGFRVECLDSVQAVLNFIEKVMHV